MRIVAAAKAAARLGLALVISGALVLAFALTAQASIDVSVDHDYDKHETMFDLWGDNGCPVEVYCNWGVTVYLRGAVVHQEDGLSGYPSYSSYRWSCKRTGTHEWVVRVYDAFDTSGFSAETSGRFKIGRCTRWRGMLVGRTRAERAALSRFRSEFVSRLRCRPRRPGGLSARWRCTVTHNNTYRQCTTELRIEFDERRRFGDYETDVWRERIKRRCVYF